MEQTQMVNVKWVAKRLNVQPGTIYRMINAPDGKLPFPFLRINNRTLRFNPKDIEAYIAKQTTGNSTSVSNSELSQI